MEGGGVYIDCTSITPNFGSKFLSTAGQLVQCLHPVSSYHCTCGVSFTTVVLGVFVPQPSPAGASDASISLRWTRCCLWTTMQWDAGRTWTASCSWTRRCSPRWPSLRMWSSWSCRSQRWVRTETLENVLIRLHLLLVGSCGKCLLLAGLLNGREGHFASPEQAVCPEVAENLRLWEMMVLLLMKAPYVCEAKGTRGTKLSWF